jgi:hypothetical protein
MAKYSDKRHCFNLSKPHITLMYGRWIVRLQNIREDSILDAAALAFVRARNRKELR